ncbi:MAG: ABC transporter permease [Chloroflexaceae bacterium]|nr:ABC transporter permease [Chloroflexaceae bacterium]
MIGFEDIARMLLTGLSYGMVLFLIASGLSLVLGAMGILNLTHGSLYMLGAFVGITLANALGGFWLVALASGLAVGLFGLLIERLFLRRLYKQFNDQVLLTLGFVYILSNLALWVWGPFPLLGVVPPYLNFSIEMGRLNFPAYRLALLGFGLAVAAGLWWLQEKTRAGAIVRAGMDDQEMTLGLGINYRLVSSAVFFLGAFIAGFAGFIGAPLTSASWDMGFPTLILALIVVVIGGVGRVEGTLAGALLIGLIDSLGKTFFPDFALFTIYIFFIAVLLFRPAGLFGKFHVGGAAPPPSAVHVERRGPLRRFRHQWQERALHWGPLLGLGAALLLLPPFVEPYMRTWMTQLLIYGLFALSLNLLFGYTGLFSLGHAAFFGVAAYTSAILSVNLGLNNFWLLLAAGVLVATLTAAVFGLVALRVSGVYFLFVTLALAELLAAVAMRWVDLTGGSNGIFGVLYPSLGLPIRLNQVSFYYLVLAVVALAALLLYRIVRSPFGLALQGIRDDEGRMRHLGYNTWLFKYLAFLISGAFAGVAGVLFAPFSGTVVPGFLGAATSSVVMLMIIIGSTRVFLGPLLGAALILFLEYYISLYVPERWPLVLGAVFVLAVLFLPGGLGVYLNRWWGRLRYTRPASPDAPGRMRDLGLEIGD